MPSPQPVILGTLIVVVIKAKNLPNKVRIGKQNPYATVTYGINKKRTTAIERGGQAPEWDEEFRFVIPEDLNDVVPDGAIVSKTGGVLPVTSVLPVETAAETAGAGGAGSERGAKILKLACWADDPRDPKLIGEAHIPLEETLKKGTKDAWIELQRKGRYAGEVFVEMTFYSNAPPPIKPAVKRAPSSKGSMYGGPGGHIAQGSDDTAEADTLREEEDGEGALRSDRRVSMTQPVGFTADYPDADVRLLTAGLSQIGMGAGITRSASSTSLRGALPPTPIQRFEPPPPSGFHDSQGHGSPLPYAWEGQHQQPPPPPAQMGYGNYPNGAHREFEGPQAAEYHEAGGGGGFEAVADRFVSQAYSTISRHPSLPTPPSTSYPTLAHPPVHWHPPPQTGPQPTFLPPPPPPPILSPLPLTPRQFSPAHFLNSAGTPTPVQQQQHQHPSYYPPPPSLPQLPQPPVQSPIGAGLPSSFSYPPPQDFSQPPPSFYSNRSQSGSYPTPPPQPHQQQPHQQQHQQQQHQIYQHQQQQQPHHFENHAPSPHQSSPQNPYQSQPQLHQLHSHPAQQQYHPPPLPPAPHHRQPSYPPPSGTSSWPNPNLPRPPVANYASPPPQNYSAPPATYASPRTNSTWSTEQLQHHGEMRNQYPGAQFYGNGNGGGQGGEGHY